MNGTAVMTAIACLNYKKAEQIALASTLITALNVLALEGNPSHFDEVLFAQKPHPGSSKLQSNYVIGLTVKYKQHIKALVCKIVTHCAVHRILLVFLKTQKYGYVSLLKMS